MVYLKNDLRKGGKIVVRKNIKRGTLKINEKRNCYFTGMLYICYEN